MKIVLYIAPHLSTGGLPQYLTKKIELLKDKYLIYVIEYDDITGGKLIIQKERIKNLIGDSLITLPWGSDKNEVINIIKNMRYLVTGAAGFIGGNYLHYLVSRTDEEIVCVDKLTSASNYLTTGNYVVFEYIPGIFYIIDGIENTGSYITVQYIAGLNLTF